MCVCVCVYGTFVVYVDWKCVCLYVVCIPELVFRMYFLLLSHNADGP